MARVDPEVKLPVDEVITIFVAASATTSKAPLTPAVSLLLSVAVITQLVPAVRNTMPLKRYVPSPAVTALSTVGDEKSPDVGSKRHAPEEIVSGAVTSVAAGVSIVIEVDAPAVYVWPDGSPAVKAIVPANAADVNVQRKHRNGKAKPRPNHRTR